MTTPHPLRSLALAALSGLAFAGMACAQPAAPAVGDTVIWTVSAPGADGVKRGARVPLTLQATVREGWHVYGLKQAPTGPTPLKVGVDASDVATADGTATGSAPVVRRDPAFGLDTQFYAEGFTLTAPVRIGAHAPAGKQAIPVSVRFQTCNGTICQPPKTVRLSAPVTVRGEG